MDKTEETLLEILLDLEADEYQTFMWHLKNIKDYPKIPKSKLEHKHKCGTVDLMVQTYIGDTIEVTKKVLAKINRNDLLEKLTSIPQASASGTSHGAEEDPVEALLPRVTALMGQSGEKSLKPGDLRKYHCELTVDMTTVSRLLRLCDSNRKVTGVWGQLQPYRNHPDRFDPLCPQLLCHEALPADRCYWEVEWSRVVLIAVSYRGIRRKGESDSTDCVFGYNDQSWCLGCSDDDDDDGGYAVYHNKISTPLSSSPPASHRVAVYVDRSAGSLSFYEVSSDRLKHLHTFNTTFTGEPLCAGFGVGYGSSVSLCPL